MSVGEGRVFREVQITIGSVVSISSGFHQDCRMIVFAEG